MTPSLFPPANLFLAGTPRRGVRGEASHARVPRHLSRATGRLGEASLPFR